MIFLAPIPALIAAAAAVPLLLSVYFLKLRRMPVRVGSTMLWDATAHDLQANVPFKWLRASLLLLLQLVILILFLLTLARPALNSSQGMPDQVFVLLDRSASMRATDAFDTQNQGNTTRFEAARSLARNAIKQTTRAGFTGTVTLLAYANQAEIVAGPTRSRSQLLDALDSLSPTDAPGDLGRALTLVAAMTRDEAADTDEPVPADAADPVHKKSKPLVVVCSDGSVDSRLPLPAVGASMRFARPRLLSDADPTIQRQAEQAQHANSNEAPVRSNPNNIGIVSLAARRDATTPARLHVFAQLLCTRTAPTTTGLTIRLDGVVVDRQAISLAAAQDDRGFSLTPLSLAFNVPSSSVLTLTIDRKDALAADNSASLTIAAPRRPRVMLVRETQSEQAGSGWLLTDVLRELDLASLTLISSAKLTELGPDALAGVDLVIYDNVPSQVFPPIASISFGTVPRSHSALAITPVEAGVEPIIWWDRTDPLMADLSLDAVRIGKSHIFVKTQANNAPDEISVSVSESESFSFEPLARTPQGVVLARIKIGRVEHLLTGFSLVQSTWPLHASFPIFLASAIDQLPGQRESIFGSSVRTDEPVSLVVGPLTTPRTLVDPDGQPVRTINPSDRHTGMVGLGVLDRVGVWQLGKQPIAVNLAAKTESALASPQRLPLAAARDDASTARRTQKLTNNQADTAGGVPHEIWPWFLIGACVLLGAEWVVYGLRVRV